MIDGKALFVFGSGDIQFVALPGEFDDKEVFSFCFKSMPADGPIGIIDSFPEWDPRNPDVLMVFPDIEYAKRVVEAMKTMIERAESYMDGEKEKRNDQA